ncbi:MAG TPA: response regulator [Verrucomicrobiae bacterium]|nr:response regulator [Verrucomicrobiae bacterium]
MSRIVRKLGEIFVANGTISARTLERALARAAAQQKKLGQVLEEMGVVTGEEVADALSVQFGCRRIGNLADRRYPKEVLDLVTPEVATLYMLFPLKKEGGRLYVAVADPTDTRIISNMAANYGLSVEAVVATRSDIIAAINRHYLNKEKESSGRGVVLIAEDDQLVAAELSAPLLREGYRVVVARDGIEAFKKAISESPHCIITDKEMPSFSGYRLLQALTEFPETRRIPVILLTASSSAEEEAEAFRKGFFDFIAKPVREATLSSRVRRAIQAHHASDILVAA